MTAMDHTLTRTAAIEDPAVVSLIKQVFAPDGAAQREHNAASASLGFGAIHYGFVVNVRPRRVLAIGSRHGYIPAVIALALKFNGEGILDFVDANYSDAAHGFGTAYGGVGHWAGDASQRFAPFNLSENVQVHVMRSSDFFASCTATYGYIYLDGNHSYEGLRYDLEQSVARAEPGAIIALHDVGVTDPAFGVGRLFDEIDDGRFGKLLIGAWPGLGIVQLKPRAQP
jgi:methyltransferase family protein